MQDQMTSGAAGQKNKTYALAMTALMAAVTCVLAPMAIPIGPVPISLTNLAIYLSLYLLGWKWGTASYVVYMLIGMVGVPVFSGFTGGLGKLARTHRRLHHRLCAHGGAGRTGDRPLPEPGGPVRGDGHGHGGVLRLRNGVVLPLHGQHCVRRPGPVCVPIHSRRCGQDAAGHDLRTYAPKPSGAGRAVPGLTDLGRGRPTLSPKVFFRRKKDLTSGAGVHIMTPTSQ